jgi:hypothetical protein
VGERIVFLCINAFQMRRVVLTWCLVILRKASGKSLVFSLCLEKKKLMVLTTHTWPTTSPTLYVYHAGPLHVTCLR